MGRGFTNIRRSVQIVEVAHIYCTKNKHCRAPDTPDGGSYFKKYLTKQRSQSNTVETKISSLPKL